ncbi:Aste57867_8467 [Aphanomyces stellatus]|uniref:Aste57867_8467 protein n=1 Tax=Aphanomyces stellatus TaxID=120398 RepID=A0A485KKD2_9STRA|nr:hypothetical protein As57867_008435 [Aphanomyces stellatus]VFT85353.1 Aste57867_8467 [Aphanomyces stellatus]
MSSRSWEPLPRGFFRCPRMTFDEEEFLRGHARKSMKDLIRLNAFADPSIRWKATGDSDRIATFQGDDVSPAQLTYMCAKTELRGTIAEVASFFDPEDELLLKQRRVFPDLLDAQVIYPLHLPSARAPRHYIGLHWMALESSATLVKPRDFCVLECHDDFTDGSGRRGWARCITSMTVTCCPALDPSSGLVRGVLSRTGCIFVESELDGRLEATYFCQIEFKGSMPRAMQITAMRRHLKAMALVEPLVLQLRLQESPFLTEGDLVPKHARKACHVCKTSFGSFGRRRRCRKCGEVVCTNCSSHVHFEALMSGPVRLRVCASCTLHVMLPSQFPNPIRTKSQRLRPDQFEDDDNVGPRSRSKSGVLGGWLTPKGKEKKGFTSKKGNQNDGSICAPRERLEQPSARTPRQPSARSKSSFDDESRGDLDHDDDHHPDVVTQSNHRYLPRKDSSAGSASSLQHEASHHSHQSNPSNQSYTHHHQESRHQESRHHQESHHHRHHHAQPLQSSSYRQVSTPESSQSDSSNNYPSYRQSQPHHKSQHSGLVHDSIPVLRQPSQYREPPPPPQSYQEHLNRVNKHRVHAPTPVDKPFRPPETELLANASMHGRMKQQQAELQRMHADAMKYSPDVHHHHAYDQWHPQQHPGHRNPMPDDDCVSAIYSICDTETMQEYLYNPLPPNQTSHTRAYHDPPPYMHHRAEVPAPPTMIDVDEDDDDDDPAWLHSVSAAPSFRPQTHDDNDESHFVEMADDALVASKPLGRLTSGAAVKLDVDLASVMKSMEACLQSDGTFDLNANASHSLLELYSQLKQLHLDQP